MRNAVALGGLAVVATGVAVTAGVVNPSRGAVDLADSIAPVAPVAGNVAHSAFGLGGAAAAKVPAKAPGKAQLQRRLQTVSRSADRRALHDPAKQAALGLTEGPAVTGRETLSSQSPQSIAGALLPSFGFSSSEMSCLVPLWMGESGWRVDAENVSSGAFGIPQALPGTKMSAAGSDWQTNPVTQITWGLGYIQERYGSPCGAWSFKQGNGWY